MDRTKRSNIELTKWIKTVEGKCPKCNSYSLIEYIDDKVLTGCLRCGWREIDSIDQSIQKALDNFKQSLDSLKRMINDF